MNLAWRRFAPTITFGYRIRETGGYTSGFDYLRLILSVLVLYGQSYVISGDHINLGFFPPWASAIRAYLILPMFFSLSGFLVAASLLRTQSFVGFLFLRGLRIVPALFVEISLSALILGPVLTSLSFAN
jgi:peptidoglycan/LPS O-acetylase OafA/YrhL